MRHARVGESYVLRLETGEEIFSAIASFAAERRIAAGAVSGIGAARDVVLGYYDREARQYVRRKIPEEMEIVSLTGNLSLKDGRPFPHLHVTLGGRDFHTVGGHFFEGRVAATCELVIQPLEGGGEVQRREDPGSGLQLLDL